MLVVRHQVGYHQQVVAQQVGVPHEQRTLLLPWLMVLALLLLTELPTLTTTQLPLLPKVVQQRMAQLQDLPFDEDEHWKEIVDCDVLDSAREGRLQIACQDAQQIGLVLVEP